MPIHAANLDACKYVCVLFRAENSEINIYSVMQSDGNRFCGNVVLDSLHMAYRHGNSVLDQKYASKNLEILIINICYFKSD